MILTAIQFCKILINKKVNKLCMPIMAKIYQGDSGGMPGGMPGEMPGGMPGEMPEYQSVEEINASESGPPVEEVD